MKSVINIDHEIRRQKALEKELGCEFIRINPEKEKFNIFRTINKIHRHIKESTEKSTKGLTLAELLSELSS